MGGKFIQPSSWSNLYLVGVCVCWRVQFMKMGRFSWLPVIVDLKGSSKQKISISKKILNKILFWKSDQMGHIKYWCFHVFLSLILDILILKLSIRFLLFHASHYFQNSLFGNGTFPKYYLENKQYIILLVFILSFWILRMNVTEFE